MAIGEDEAMATVERHPQEIAQILEQFKKLMALGEDGFLIVQIDDFYVQFYVSTATRLDIEAISNHFLSAKKQLDAQGIVKLLGFGFAPPEEGFNFTMSYTLSGEADFSYLAVLALAALFDVYHAPEHEPLSFELNSAA
jgi:sulfur relay (sulfurtransferase) DsrC/TusE family protein